jgi:hypothetical protein
MLTVTYDSDGAAFHHTITVNQSVNSEYYCKFLENHLHPAEQQKQPHSSTNDAQKCTLPCDKTWVWASVIVEVGTSDIFPTFQT